LRPGATQRGGDHIIVHDKDYGRTDRRVWGRHVYGDGARNGQTQYGACLLQGWGVGEKVCLPKENEDLGGGVGAKGNGPGVSTEAAGKLRGWTGGDKKSIMKWRPKRFRPSVSRGGIKRLSCWVMTSSRHSPRSMFTGGRVYSLSLRGGVAWLIEAVLVASSLGERTHSWIGLP